jgi:2-keto-3-deoxy-L-rhamnonate aldolase RhmA
MQLIAITNRPSTAALYEQIGIDRVLVDLERIGKAERQHGRQTWISDHSVEDVSKLRAVLRAATLMVRVDAVNDESRTQIDESIARGGEVLMLPMARRPDEVRRFVDLVGGRARTCLLLETADALDRADEILAIRGLDEIHVGLNDLHVTLGLTCMFEILARGLLDRLAEMAAATGKTLGIGGVGAIGRADIDPKLILAEHVRLGSRMVILSRSFFAGLDVAASPETLATVSRRVRDLRAHVEHLREMPRDELVSSREALQDNVARYLSRLAASDASTNA